MHRLIPKSTSIISPARLDPIDQHSPPTRIRAHRPGVHQSLSDSAIKELKHSPIIQPIPSRGAHFSNPPGREASNPTFDPDIAFDRPLLGQRCTSPASPVLAPPECAAGQLCVRCGLAPPPKGRTIPRRVMRPLPAASRQTRSRRAGLYSGTSNLSIRSSLFEIKRINKPSGFGFMFGFNILLKCMINSFTTGYSSRTKFII